MKTLAQYDTIDRAALLFQLFPQEIPALVGYLDGMSLTVMEDEKRLRQSWNNGLITFDLWLSCAREMHSRIRKYGAALFTNKRLFTDQLFDGYISAFTVHCIQVMISTSQQVNQSFDHGLRMLFES